MDNARDSSDQDRPAAHRSTTWIATKVMVTTHFIQARQELCVQYDPLIVLQSLHVAHESTQLCIVLICQ